MTAPHIDPQVIFDKLTALGGPDEIAQFLQAEQITGDHSLSHCPVAQYVRRETGVVVAVARANWYDPVVAAVTFAAGVDDQPVAHPLSEPVSRFVVRHDSYMYPLLTSYRRR